MDPKTRGELLISAGELASSLDDGALRVIDCRFDLTNPAAGREAYLAAHIPGAVYADLDRDLAAPVEPMSGRHPLPGLEAVTATFRRLGINRGSRVVVYDAAGGAIAARAWWMLNSLGHAGVRLLDGGFPAWLARRYTCESGPVTVARGDFIAEPREGTVSTTAGLVEALQSGNWPVIVDARDAARFRGDLEPIDSVAGHIPRTLNLPYLDTLNDDGTFRSRRMLRTLWQDVLGHDQGIAWCAMCGSGVTACHLAISALMAGYREPSIYVGSWSEWIRDPARPVATGES